MPGPLRPLRRSHDGSRCPRMCRHIRRDAGAACIPCRPWSLTTSTALPAPASLLVRSASLLPCPVWPLDLTFSALAPHPVACGFVASRCRPWGSPGRPRRPASRRSCRSASSRRCVGGCLRGVPGAHALQSFGPQSEPPSCCQAGSTSSPLPLPRLDLKAFLPSPCRRCRRRGCTRCSELCRFAVCSLQPRCLRAVAGTPTPRALLGFPWSKLQPVWLRDRGLDAAVPSVDRAATAEVCPRCALASSVERASGRGGREPCRGLPHRDSRHEHCALALASLGPHRGETCTHRRAHPVARCCDPSASLRWLRYPRRPVCSPVPNVAVEAQGCGAHRSPRSPPSRDSEVQRPTRRWPARWRVAGGLGRDWEFACPACRRSVRVAASLLRRGASPPPVPMPAVSRFTSPNRLPSPTLLTVPRPAVSGLPRRSLQAPSRVPVVSPTPRRWWCSSCVLHRSAHVLRP